MNSRHPGPRRVWKVGSVARWLPPLPRDPPSPAGSGPVYQTVVSCTRNDTFPSPKALKSLPGQGLARGSPMGAKGTPKGTQREPSGKFRAPSGTISDYSGQFLTVFDYFGFVFPQNVKIPGKRKCPKKCQTKLKSGTAGYIIMIYHDDISS